jgi:hypothetical protein
MAAIKTNLHNTAAGMDGITARLLKGGEGATAGWLHRVILRVWRSGKTPAAWRRALLAPLFKSGDPLAANDHRGFCLLSIPGKVCVHLSHNRLRMYLCDQLLPEQYGFCPDRGTPDALFSLRRLTEIHRAHGQPHVAGFVDLTKAFDSVPRPVRALAPAAH